MSKNKNTSGQDPKGTGKPDAAGSTPKKPTPIIDLKATEVKTLETGKSPKNKLQGNEKSGVEDKKETSATADKASDKDNGKPTSAKSAVPTAGAAANNTNKTDPVAPAAPTANEKTAKETGSSGGKPTAASAKNTASEAAKAIARSEAPKQGEKRRSGGTLAGVFTHMVASVLGGLLVLFAAQPIEQEFGLKVLPRPEIPAAFEARLAALERRPAVDPAAIKGDLDDRVEELRAQFASLDALRKQIRELAARPLPEPAKTTQSAEVDGLLKAFDRRVAKLEATLENLASAVDANGRPTRLAGLTSLSGKLIEVETSLLAKIDELRKGLTQQVETQFSEVGKVASSAQAATKRFTRELAEAGNAIAQLQQRTETFQVKQARMDANVRNMGEETSRLRADIDAFKEDLDRQLKSVASQQDVKGAVVSVSKQLTAFQDRLTAIVASEEDRKANAQRIVMALELGNLKRALNRGGAYDTELQEVKKIVGSTVDLSTLEKYRTQGVATLDELQQEFSKLAYAAIQASQTPQDGNFMERLMGGVKSTFRVRPTNLPASDTSVEAIVGRIEAQLKINNLAGAVDEAQKLPQASIKSISGWMAKVEARAAIDRSIYEIEKQLKSSLVAVAGQKG